MAIYQLADLNADNTVHPGQVVRRPDGGWALQCPCDFRTVYVNEPPHSLEFAESGRLDSMGGSCGMHGLGDIPANWCHFTITDGVATMHGDAKCPGAKAD